MDRNIVVLPSVSGMFSVALRKESVDRNHQSLNLPSRPIESLSARRAWIEIFIGPLIFNVQPSLSARRAWIEIAGSLDDILAGVVALRKESVDRNLVGGVNRAIDIVALRKESVDRNNVQPRKTEAPGVALRKESVDRNLYYGDDLTFSDGSLSARRAWIEITGRSVQFHLFSSSLSARRAWIEIIKFVNLRVLDGSLSARRAWIEIASCWRVSGRTLVALRKESVDRNRNTQRTS